MMSKQAFVRALEREAPLILDGGLATQLEAQGCDIGNALWSASLLQSNPEAIFKAMRAYLDAGAECIATASYQASREGFASVGLSGEEADELMLLSVDLAERARDEYLAANPGVDFTPLVAASIGPYGAMLHDGSEYRGNYGVSADTLRDFHAPRLQLFDASNADVLAIETIPSVVEARVLAELLADCDLPAWISFSCKDETHLVDGTPVAEVAGQFRNHPAVVAVGINCTPPQFAPELIRKIRVAVPDKAVVVYPNSGETYSAEDNAWFGTVTPGDCASAARTWIDAGARIVGGCCRMGPEHIRAMRRALT
ncbi:MAG: homocysteine S-methyltransferase [Gammaproteobacteria bacterium]|jgi:homocysteine S-methyltransferase|nr:homocysteine S-methyltransferase [Gammaproteobacteria bacterium]MDH3819624.1 homocysteine S-methyltransferase [Gammaproteobacteria bacterium]